MNDMEQKASSLMSLVLYMTDEVVVVVVVVVVVMVAPYHYHLSPLQ